MLTLENSSESYMGDDITKRFLFGPAPDVFLFYYNYI